MNSDLHEEEPPFEIDPEDPVHAYGLALWEVARATKTTADAAVRKVVAALTAAPDDVMQPIMDLTVRLAANPDKPYVSMVVAEIDKRAGLGDWGVDFRPEGIKFWKMEEDQEKVWRPRSSGSTEASTP